MRDLVWRAACQRAYPCSRTQSPFEIFPLFHQQTDRGLQRALFGSQGRGRLLARALKELLFAVTLFNFRLRASHASTLPVPCLAVAGNSEARAFRDLPSLARQGTAELEACEARKREIEECYCEEKFFERTSKEAAASLRAEKGTLEATIGLLMKEWEDLNGRLRTGAR